MMALVLSTRPTGAEVVGGANAVPELDRGNGSDRVRFHGGKGILFVSSDLASMGPQGEKLLGAAIS